MQRGNSAMRRRHLAIACVCVACCMPSTTVDAQTSALPNPAPSWLDPTPPEPTEIADASASTSTARPKVTTSTPSGTDTASTATQTPGRFSAAQKWLSRFNGTRDGWTPRIGTVASGSGVAFGSTWQQPVMNGAMRVTTDAMISVRGYYTLEVGAFATPFGKRPIVVGARVRQEGFPQEDFYGVGPHSSMSDRTSYMREGLDMTGYITFAPRTWLNIETSAGFLDMRVRAGEDKNFPSIEQRFAPATAPGLGADGDMFHVGVMLDADRRDDDFFPRAGGRYIGSVTAFHGIADFRDDFTRADVDLRKYFAVPGTTNHAIAIRGQFAFSGGAGDSSVPFYMLPRLGGSNTLRAYETSRFTDQHAMVFAAEYRYLMLPKLQLVGFVEGGQVASRLSAFNLPTFKTSYGAGIRYRIKDAAVIRVDVARGQEGNRWIVGFSPGF
jgi:hypothetical protein